MQHAQRGRGDQRSGPARGPKDAGLYLQGSSNACRSRETVPAPEHSALGCDAYLPRCLRCPSLTFIWCPVPRTLADPREVTK